MRSKHKIDKNINTPIIGQQFLSRHIPEKLLLELVPTWPVVFWWNHGLIAKERYVVVYKYTFRQIHRNLQQYTYQVLQ